MDLQKNAQERESDYARPSRMFLRRDASEPRNKSATPLSIRACGSAPRALVLQPRVWNRRRHEIQGTDTLTTDSLYPYRPIRTAE